MSEPTNEEMDPVFRAYGAACYSAQNLESTLRFLLVLVAAKERRQFTPDVIKFVESETAMLTLRTLFDKAREKEYFTDIESQCVFNAIKKRNNLVHSYWDRNVSLLKNPGGRTKVTDDLYSNRDYLRKANSIVTSLNDRYLSEYSMSTEELKKMANDAWGNDTDT